MPTGNKKKTAEQWVLYYTLEAATRFSVPYGPNDSTTPYSDAYRKVYEQLTDVLLGMSTETVKAIKIRTQERTRLVSAMQREAVIKLYIYTRRIGK